MATNNPIEVDASQVHSIEVDPSQVSAPAAAVTQPQGSALGRFAGGLVDSLNPLPMLKGLMDASDDPAKTRAGIKNLIDAHTAQLAKAKESWNKGEHVEALGHLLGGAVPLVGPAAAAAGEKIGGTDPVYDKFGAVVTPGQAPDVAGGLGSATGLVGQMAAPMAVEAAGKLAPGLMSSSVRPRLLPQANPKVTAALDYLESKGVPGNAAARSGNGMVQHVQKLVDTTPLGAVVAHNAAGATVDALTAEAGSLTSRATPPVPPDALYGKFHAAEAKSPMPVSVGDLKPQLQPIFDTMQWMPAAERSNSAGYTAVKKILQGPDVIPASQAEVGLSGIKALAREGTGRSQGVAKFITPKLQGLIDNAASKAGPEVVTALQQGREAAASQMGADFLDKAFTKAQNEGGFHREAGIFADWQRLKPSDKLTLFRSPGLVSDLDKFFLGAKKLAENPNPSGSGLLAWVGGQGMIGGGLAVAHPMTGATYMLGAGALSKMMHSSAGVRALTKGIRISMDATAPAAAKAAAVSQILKMAGPDAQPAALPRAAGSSDPSQQTAPLATVLPMQ